ncbi:hypothetical protein Tco_1097435, partial [Tanacetum coccineum]
MCLTEECTLQKEDKVVEQNKYMRSLEEIIIKFYEDSIREHAADDEWIRKFIKNTDSNIMALKTTTKNLQKKTYQLTQTVLINTGEKVKARTTMGKENVKEPVPRDVPVVQTYVPPMKFLAQEDEGNTDDSWDITVKNVDRFRQILTPIIHTLPNLEPMVQSYVTRGPVHDKEKVVREKEQDYDIPLQDHFGEEFADNTRVSKKIDSNPVNDLKELLKTYDFETFIQELLHQLSQSSHETGKAKREMKSHQQKDSSKVMELENSQNNALAKLPMLKLGEYEMWEIRINTPEFGPLIALKMTVPSTAEEKICKKNDVKAPSLLLMALPNEHQLTFNQYVDAQSMFAAIKARFGGNEATKRTQ